MDIHVNLYAGENTDLSIILSCKFGCTCIIVEFYGYSEYSKSTWHLVDTAIHDQLGSHERIQEKIEKIKLFAREAAVSSDDGAEVQGLRDALSVLQTREREFHLRAEVKQVCFCGYNQPF